MLKAVLILLLALPVAASPAFAARRVTVEQLNRILVSSRKEKEKDALVAARLYGLQLTQRLSTKKRAAFEAELRGRRARHALAMLADRSEFMPLPAAEIPTKPEPGVKRQVAIVTRSIDYVAAMLHEMPNLFARLKTTYYIYRPAGERLSRDPAHPGLVPYTALHRVKRSKATVYFRDGREVVEGGKRRRRGKHAAPPLMMTNGEFGPIFAVIFGDLRKGKLQWSRWAEGPDGLDAVFRFTVPRRASHYRVGFCCVRGRVSRKFSAYHGELTVDPATGTILRLTMIAEDKNLPGSRWEIMVKYGPVQVGGKKLFCPVKSIAVYRGPVPDAAGSPLGSGPGWTMPLPPMAARAGAPLETQVNEMVFDHYHLFRATVRILPFK